MGVQYSLWGGSVMNLGTERHKKQYFDDIDKFVIPGSARSMPFEIWQLLMHAVIHFNSVSKVTVMLLQDLLLLKGCVTADRRSRN